VAIISFEHLADDGKIAEIPNGYRDFLWNNFYAMDDETYPNSGAYSVIHSGEASAFNGLGKPARFRSPDHDDDFDLSTTLPGYKRCSLWRCSREAP